MKKLIVLIFSLFIVSTVFSYSRVFAEEPLTDWVIQDFQSDILVNKNSSLLITEKITADCGTLPDKHGIFRVLPLQYQKTSNEKVKTPIELISITDFNDNPIKYSTSTVSNSGIDALTWKIGDANKTVSGLNYYKITYKVKNVVRFDNSNFDELYWNLSGNFWQIGIEKFNTVIHLPSEINQTNTENSLYSGSSGGNDGSAKLTWSEPSTIVIENASVINPGSGVTLSLTFPKNIISPYKFSFWELYAPYLLFIIPIIVFIICYHLWNKYGRDPKINSAIVPEFEIPGNLTPLAMGVLHTNGEMKNSFIPAEIIYLATKRYISIKQIREKTMFKEADYEFTLLTNELSRFTQEDKTLLNRFFATITKNETVKLSSLKNNFYREISTIKEGVTEFLVNQRYLLVTGTKIKYFMIGFAVTAFIASIIFFGVNSSFAVFALISLMISAIVLFVFAILMPNRTKDGAFLNHRIKGFKLYMETAEKYRAQFNEKENIFEKFLPYAIMFGMTKKWIKEMKNIYGQDFISSYHPIWFYGMAGNSFDFDSFASNIESVSAQMGSTMTSNPSSSGSGGGGFSGGGGGGGGGGGW